MMNYNPEKMENDQTDCDFINNIRNAGYRKSLNAKAAKKIFQASYMADQEKLLTSALRPAS